LDALFLAGQACSVTFLLYGAYLFVRCSPAADEARAIAQLALYESLGKLTVK
jgi:hypothetical protein